MTSAFHPFARLRAAYRAPRVTLRPLEVGDRFCIRRWMRDPAVISYTVVVSTPDYGAVDPYTVEEADSYLELLMTASDRKSYAILNNGDHVGNVGLKHIDLRGRKAECFIEIGEHSVRRRGVAAQAMRAVLDVAFLELRLDVVSLGVFAFNAAAIGLYRKVGFAETGKLGVHWAEGCAHDIIAMRIDRQRWRSRSFLQ